MIAELQVQEQARRFATTAAHQRVMRRMAVLGAIELLRVGDRAGALAVMYAGLAAQAPLTFKIPEAAA